MSYYYRIEPKGNLAQILADGGLSTALPGKHPGSYVDHPEVERWPDQEEYNQRSARLYFAVDQWEVPRDRFAIRVPADVIERHLQGPDSLGDYFIDTDDDEVVVVPLSELEVKIGGKWKRGNALDWSKYDHWKKFYKRPGFYGNRFHDENPSLELKAEHILRYGR